MLRGEWKARPADNDAMDLEGTSEDTSDEDVYEETFDQVPFKSGIGADKAMDSLTNAMDSLAFVPSNVKFGRGAKNTRPPRAVGSKVNRGAHAGIDTVPAFKTEANNHLQNVQGSYAPINPIGRGSGNFRSRGRGRGISNVDVSRQPHTENSTAGEEPISINIEGALSALKEEASSTGRPDAGSILPHRDFESRTRISNRGIGRGRIHSSRGRSRGFLR